MPIYVWVGATIQVKAKYTSAAVDYSEAEIGVDVSSGLVGTKTGSRSIGCRRAGPTSLKTGSSQVELRRSSGIVGVKGQGK